MARLPVISPIPLEDAWERLLGLASPLGGETVAVDDAAGRYLLESLEARRTQPAEDLGVMDGFAVGGEGPWRIVGEARAGHAFAEALAAGEAVRISTGAACPSGTAAVIPVEQTAVEREILRASAPEHGAYIRRRGFDFAAGEPVLPGGTLVGPAQIALARAAGHAQLTVGRRPSVAIFECGDELVANPRDCPPGRLPASNGAMVTAMARGVGAVVRTHGPLPDERSALARAFDDALDANVLVTTAGASVGDHDHARGALEDSGFTLNFWRVAIRPGKPLLVARRGAQILLGLPGNPVSSYVTAHLFLLPLLRALQGARQILPRALPLPLARPLPPGGDRREFMRGTLADGRAMPFEERDSSALLTLARAELLIDRPVGAAAAAEGASVWCHWIGNGDAT